MASFSSNSFSTGSFYDQSFDFGEVVVAVLDYIITFRRRRR